MFSKLKLISKNPRLLMPARNHLYLNALRVFNAHFRKNNDVGMAKLPESITIRVSGVCNLECKMCSYICKKQSPQFIDVSLIEKLVKDINSSWPYVSITGGEPLLHPEIEKIINLLKRGGRFVTLTTNGTLLKKKTDMIARSNLDILIVSIDGPKKIHDQIRGINGTFERAIEGIIALKNKKNRPLIFLNCSINNLNYAKLEEVIKLANDLKIEGVNFQHLWFLSDEINLPKELKMVPKELRDFDLTTLWEQIKKIKKSRIPINIFPNLSFFEIVRYYQTFFNFKPRFTNKGTDCPWHHVIIKTNGDLIQCNKQVMGNIGEENFWEVWNGRKFQDFRKHFNAKGRVMPECVRCCNYFRD